MRKWLANRSFAMVAQAAEEWLSRHMDTSSSSSKVEVQPQSHALVGMRMRAMLPHNGLQDAMDVDDPTESPSLAPKGCKVLPVLLHITRGTVLNGIHAACDIVSCAVPRRMGYCTSFEN